MNVGSVPLQSDRTRGKEDINTALDRWRNKYLPFDRMERSCRSGRFT